jgi:peptidoglycan/LPS O-acetylase OafA/YrhL
MIAERSHSGHVPDLDGLRALSILAVLAAHMLPLGPARYQLNSMAGTVGMSVFFCLSGFLITSFLWHRPDVKAFMIRRVARIAPLVLLVSTIYCLIFLDRTDSFLAVNAYLLNYSDRAINGWISPLWSVAMEMQFYVAIAACFAVLGRRAIWLVAIAALAVTALRIDNEIFSSIRTHYRLDEILSGCLLAVLWLHRDAPRAAAVLGLLRRSFWPIFGLWLLSCHPQVAGVPYLRPYLAAMMVGSVLATEAGWQKSLLSSHVLGYIATISFALYVWHSPFRHGWFSQGEGVEKYLLYRSTGIALTFLLAHLSTFYFEKPITDAVRRWTSHRPGRIARPVAGAAATASRTEVRPILSPVGSQNP